MVGLINMHRSWERKPNQNPGQDERKVEAPANDWPSGKGGPQTDWPTHFL